MRRTVLDPARAPTFPSPYAQLVVGPGRLYADNGRSVPLPDDALLTGALAMGRGRAVLWIHESAHEWLHLPADPPRPLPRELAGISLDGDPWSSVGWARVSHQLHVALPAWSGDFAGTPTPSDLSAALSRYHELVGTTFLYSPASTTLFMIDDREFDPPVRDPGVAYVVSPFATPAHVWSRALGAKERARPFVQLFDRRASYLAAWRSCELSDGGWIELARPLDERRPGYYLLDTRPLRQFLEAERLPDPFVRPDASGGPTWLMAPLATLARELADEAGVALQVERAVVAQRSIRPLDAIAARLAHALAVLTMHPDSGDVSAVLTRTIKAGYVRATAHLEHGRRRPHPLARPEWRHTIIDRHVANTYRSLRRAARRPVAVGYVDGALFAVDGDGDWPEGLREGSELGTWRRRRGRLDTAEAADLIEHGRARELVQELVGKSE